MDYNIARKKMIKEQLLGRGIKNLQVLESMMRVPRHEFVDPGLKAQAYLDHPLNIGQRQTISHPYIVGRMTEAAAIREGEKVLEIGTGSGYQTAILAELSRQVYSIERITTLSNRARRTLYRLGYVNVTLRIGDGTLGWPEEAPFDVILVTAGTPKVPQAYLNQLAPGGRLVIPRGPEKEQSLLRLTKNGKGVTEEVLGPCRFVKLLGRYGWQDS